MQIKDFSKEIIGEKPNVTGCLFFSILFLAGTSVAIISKGWDNPIFYTLLFFVLMTVFLIYIQLKAKPSKVLIFSGKIIFEKRSLFFPPKFIEIGRLKIKKIYGKGEISVRKYSYQIFLETDTGKKIKIGKEQIKYNSEPPLEVNQMIEEIAKLLDVDYEKCNVPERGLDVT